jgi:hypothetical protein
MSNMENNIFRIFYGHSLYIENGDLENNPLNIEINQNDHIIITLPNIVEKTSKIKTRLKYLLFFLYNAGIISIISWSIFHTIIHSIREKTNKYILTEIFQFAFLIQYIIGLRYFNTKSFKQNISKDQNIKNNLGKLSLISLILVLCMSLLTILLTIYNQSTNEYSVYHQIYTKSIGTTILLCLNRFYTFGAFFSNMTIFFIFMFFKKKIINDYVQEIRDHIRSSTSLSDKVIKTTSKIQKIKNDYDHMIDDLNIFFSSLSVIGIIGIYFVIMNILTKKTDSIETINASLFLIVEVLYINIAQNLRSLIKGIDTSIKDPILFNEGDQYNMILNNDPNPDEKKLRENLSSVIEISTAIHASCKNINERLLWTKLNEILKSEWNSFQFFGIQIKDTALIQKIFALVIGFIFTSNVVSVSNFASLQ